MASGSAAHELMTPSSASSSKTSLHSSHPSPHPSAPLSVNSVLQQFSSLGSPHLAALEHVVSERNTLVAQNSQLWKLMEKQRSAYSQALKEIERIRAERDSYRTKLQSLSTRDARGNASSRHGSDAKVPVSSDDLEISSPPPLGSRVSEEFETPRNSQQYTLSSRTPTSQASLDQTVHVDRAPLAIERATVTVPLSVTVPPRAESLTFQASSGTAAPIQATPSSSLSPRSRAEGLPSMQQEITHQAPSESSPVPSHSQAFQSPYPTRNNPDQDGSSQSHGRNPLLPSHTPSGASSLDSAFESIPAHRSDTGQDPSLSDPSYRDISQLPALPDSIPTSSIDLRSSPLPDYERCSEADHASLHGHDYEEYGLGYEDNHNRGTDDYITEPDDMSSTRHDSPSIHTKGNTLADDFPLPPTGATHLHSAQSSSEASSLRSEPPYVPRGDSPTSYISSTSSHYRETDGDPALSPSQAPQDSSHSVPALADLSRCRIRVITSYVRPNDRGKDILSFSVVVSPGYNQEPWKIEKRHSDVLLLDHAVRSRVSRSLVKKIGSLPDTKLWKDHAPAKADQRKAILESYLQSLIDLPVEDKHDVIRFLTSDVVRDTQKPVMQPGHKEGYLTKRGKNFGGWKSRYFVLQGPSLEYYESRGGTHLGSICVSGAQIGRQQKSSEKASLTDDDKEYRHAFLIVEAKKGPGGNHTRHVLCADSDAERDSWVNMLVRYFSGVYEDEGNGSPNKKHMSTYDHAGLSGSSKQSEGGSHAPVSSQSILEEDLTSQRTPVASHHHDNLPVQGTSSQARTRSEDSSQQQFSLQSSKDVPQESGSSTHNRSNGSSALPNEPRTSSALSQHSELDRPNSPPEPSVAVQMAQDGDTTPLGKHVTSNQSNRAESKSNPSKGANGNPIPSRFKFGAKEHIPEPVHPPSDRREKAKSRSFWNFNKLNDKPPPIQSVPHASRMVFGVSLEESLAVARVEGLPAIAYRCITYLQAKQAEQEEGIYRLSGSSAVIKSLRDRFNSDGDVDLLSSDEFWDLHAIAGLLKSFLRELPTSILTRDLHLRFLAVIDLPDPAARIRELSELITSLPKANYALLRALTAHLILIVRNSNINKMTMRNVGIVFSPTLGIPAGVFSLMLGEFDRVFSVDPEEVPHSSMDGGPSHEDPQPVVHPKNELYDDAASSHRSGLPGERPSVPVIKPDSDPTGDLLTATFAEQAHLRLNKEEPVLSRHIDGASSSSSGRTSKAQLAAGNRGLNVNTGDRAAPQHGRSIGLPNSPRPPPTPDASSNHISSSS